MILQLHMGKIMGKFFLIKKNWTQLDSSSQMLGSFQASFFSF